MLSLEEMLIRLAVAVLIGAVVGFERDLAGKEAGVRTDIMVAAGAAIFTIIGLIIPAIITAKGGSMNEVLAHNAGFVNIIANIVVGIGFLGAGVIIKQGARISGVTTAGTVWFVAALGILCGLGLLEFAAIAGAALTFILYMLRKIDFYSFVNKK